MTGNIVLLGFGIAGSGGLPVVAPLVSLGAFLVGSAVGGVLAVDDRRLVMRSTSPARSGSRSALILAAAIVAAATDVRPSTLAGDAVIALLALAMGVRNATVRRLAVPDLTTTVLTMTLTGLAADSRVAGGSGAGLGAQDHRRAGDALRSARRSAAAQDQPRPRRSSPRPRSRSSWRWPMYPSPAAKGDRIRSAIEWPVTTASGDDSGAAMARHDDPPPGAPVPPILPPQEGFLFLDRDKFHASFAADIPAEQAAFMADSQVPWGWTPWAARSASRHGGASRAGISSQPTTG